MTSTARTVLNNRLVESFDVDAQDKLRSISTVVELKIGEVICDPGAKIDQVYFPEGAVISVQTVLENGDVVETGVVGAEGAFGLLASSGDGLARSRAVVQLGGRLRRVPAALLHRDLLPIAQVRELILRYLHGMLTQVQQTAACNASHSTRQRMARWLLTMHDHLRAGGHAEASLPYTHDFLSRMLGTTRKSVTLAAQSMQSEGLIRYHRGQIVVLDRPGLEVASCECYAAQARRFGPDRTPTRRGPR